ncbi:hypothetical protein M3P21_21035 [Ruegeria sp. 2012CJ41-6]|uniref:Uncharacterized protein n=1 Tax=Ruegeria spongiae TaxID=2942209 RepID=A0ABT0Q804_9RHOB|nr:hypothetical protein [Ruegeria spongiae]MCL6286004.1 hypothetical protein [Ruegeria spongiae]
MKFYSKENPRREGPHYPTETTGSGVPGFNPKCNQRGGYQPEQQDDQEQTPSQ